MRFDVRTEAVPYAPRSAFERKWGVKGYTTPAVKGEIKVVVSYSAELPSPLGGGLVPREHVAGLDGVVRTTLGHEIGHSTQVAEGARRPSELTHDERFEVEVDAWLRENTIRGMSYVDATLMLDALNTYRRGYDISDGTWQDARVRVEPLCDNPTIREYVPLEPDPNDEPACAGAGGHAGGSEEEADEAEADDEGEGDEGDGEGDDGAGDERRDDGRDDVDIRARDAWLTSEDGMTFTKNARHWNHFRNHMVKHWRDGVNDLPAVTKTILAGRGRS